MMRLLIKKSYELQSDSNIAQDVQRLDKITARNKSMVPVVVFIEQGIIPRKIENKLAIPVPNGIVNIAFATYDKYLYFLKSLKIKINQNYEQSYVVSDNDLHWL